MDLIKYNYFELLSESKYIVLNNIEYVNYIKMVSYVKNRHCYEKHKYIILKRTNILRLRNLHKL